MYTPWNPLFNSLTSSLFIFSYVFPVKSFVTIRNLEVNFKCSHQATQYFTCFQIYSMLFILWVANIFVCGEASFHCKLMPKLLFIFCFSIFCFCFSNFILCLGYINVFPKIIPLPPHPQYFCSNKKIHTNTKLSRSASFDITLPFLLCFTTERGWECSPLAVNIAILKIYGSCKIGSYGGKKNLEDSKTPAKRG